jgi:hypothetical protein
MHLFQRFTSFLIPSEKKVFGCVFNQFCTAPLTSSSDENLLPLRAFSLGQIYGNLTVHGFSLYSKMDQNHTFHIPPKSVNITLLADG